MFYNSLFQSVFDFWIKLSKKIVAKLQKKVNDFAVKSGSKNYKRVRDTSLWKFTGYACGIKVNFSPCVMTWAVLAKFVKFVLGTPKRCAMDKEYMLVLFEKANYNNIRRDRYGLYDIKRS